MASHVVQAFHAGLPMLTLTLFRHAKSSWDDRAQADADRPLNARGRHAAPVMGRFLAKAQMVPDRVLCSTAVRTRETAALALAEMPGAPAADYLDALYLASPGQLLAHIRRVPGTVQHLMVIGHNPGIHELAAELVGHGVAIDRKRLLEKFPTAGIAVIRFPALTWSAVRPGMGELIAFVTPRSLEDGAPPPA